MLLARLNPVIHSVVCYEKPLKTELCRAYEARCFFVLSGGVTIRTEDGTPYKLAPGACLYLPPATAFRVKCDYARLVCIRFDLTDGHVAQEAPPAAPLDAFEPALVRAVEDGAPFDAPLYIEELSAERETFLHMQKIFATGGEYAHGRVSCMLKDVLLRIAEGCDEGALPSRLVEALDEYIREHADEEISNTELGAIFGYHPFYISQLLKKRRGVTLHQYILSYKLTVAADKLRYTAASVADIAASLGFSDASYFTKSFKSVYGMTPKDYRKATADQPL